MEGEKSMSSLYLSKRSTIFCGFICSFAGRVLRNVLSYLVRDIMGQCLEYAGRLESASNRGAERRLQNGLFTRLQHCTIRSFDFGLKYYFDINFSSK